MGCIFFICSGLFWFIAILVMHTTKHSLDFLGANAPHDFSGVNESYRLLQVMFPKLALARCGAELHNNGTIIYRKSSECDPVLTNVRTSPSI